VPAPFLRCPAGRLEQAASSNAFLNAIRNAFSKLFISSKAPICCIIATKRSWRPPSVAGLVRNFRIIMATPRKAEASPHIIANARAGAVTLGHTGVKSPILLEFLEVSLTFVQPAEPRMATRRRNKFQQRTDSLALISELSFAGVAYRIS
jgi:hypothetical protein